MVPTLCVEYVLTSESENKLVTGHVLEANCAVVFVVAGWSCRRRRQQVHSRRVVRLWLVCVVYSRVVATSLLAIVGEWLSRHDSLAK